MRRERKNRLTEDFSGPLWDDPHPEYAPVEMEELAKASHEETFRQDWLYPLLDEGLELERVLDLLLASTARPN